MCLLTPFHTLLAHSTRSVGRPIICLFNYNVIMFHCTLCRPRSPVSIERKRPFGLRERGTEFPPPRGRARRATVAPNGAGRRLSARPSRVSRSRARTPGRRGRTRAASRLLRGSLGSRGPTLPCAACVCVWSVSVCVRPPGPARRARGALARAACPLAASARGSPCQPPSPPHTVVRYKRCLARTCTGVTYVSVREWEIYRKLRNTVNRPIFYKSMRPHPRCENGLWRCDCVCERDTLLKIKDCVLRQTSTAKPEKGRKGRQAEVSAPARPASRQASRRASGRPHLRPSSHGFSCASSRLPARPPACPAPSGSCPSSCGARPSLAAAASSVGAAAAARRGCPAASGRPGP